MKKVLLFAFVASLGIVSVLAQTASNPASYTGSLDDDGPIMTAGLPRTTNCDSIYTIGDPPVPEYPSEVEQQQFYVTESSDYNVIITATGDPAFGPFAMLYQDSFDIGNPTGNCLAAWSSPTFSGDIWSDTIDFERFFNANTQYILVVSHRGQPTTAGLIKTGPFSVTISTAGDGLVCIGALGTCDEDNGNNGDGNGTPAPVIMTIPNRGMIQISTWQAQPLYNTPGGQPVRDAGNNEIWLPNDAGNDGYDTYIITEIAMYNDRLWLGIFMGSSTWGWVPADNITPLNYIPGYDDYMSSLQ